MEDARLNHRKWDHRSLHLVLSHACDAQPGNPATMKWGGQMATWMSGVPDAAPAVLASQSTPSLSHQTSEWATWSPDELCPQRPPQTAGSSAKQCFLHTSTVLSCVGLEFSKRSASNRRYNYGPGRQVVNTTTHTFWLLQAPEPAGKERGLLYTPG